MRARKKLAIRSEQRADGWYMVPIQCQTAPQASTGRRIGGKQHTHDAIPETVASCHPEPGPKRISVGAIVRTDAGSGTVVQSFKERLGVEIPGLSQLIFCKPNDVILMADAQQ